MPYWRLFYHLVWATKGRAPLLDDLRGAVVERSIRSTCDEPGMHLFDLALMLDHVHLVVSIPPRLAISGVVQRLKGASSFAANGADLPPQANRFAWQNEYGIFSFGEKSLPTVIDYVRNQTARHAANTLWPALERLTDP